MTTAVLEQPPQVVSTTRDLLAIPDDGVERWLIDGVITEVGMTRRKKHHSQIEAQVSLLLGVWLSQQPPPRGDVYSGEVGVILRPNPELTVGIDVVYLNADQVAANEADEESTLLVGAPTLAVEILSPSDTVENIRRKLGWYAQCEVPLVWVIDPHFRTLTVHRRQQPPVLLNEQHELDGGTELPGFRVPVARLFER